MQLYNTRSRQKVPFVPADPGRVTMYVCGPTVYGYAHIGNARPAVVFDILARLLRHKYDSVIYARNITDIDDKINKAAAEEGVDIATVTERYIRAYHDDLTALGVLPPDIEPRVTTHMAQIFAMIQELLDRNNAYVAEGHVLFHVPSFANYGELSGRDREDMIAGARVEVAPYKKDPADFVLWKPSTAEQPGWDSPWGRGRPGWHIECSAMIDAHLGATIDIHGGGNDLIFPHHENENAQSSCSHDGAALARFWVHNGFVNVAKEKMSKSLGNVVLVRDLLRQAPGEAVRMALVNAHYRAPLDWSDDALQQARRRLDGLYQALRDLSDVQELPDRDRYVTPGFLAALEDDLNTPVAMAELADLSRQANKAENKAEREQLKSALLACGNLLGLLQQDPEQWFAGLNDAVDPSAVNKLIEERRTARANKNFARADQIRDQLADMGIAIEDKPDGTRWRYLGQQ